MDQYLGLLKRVLTEGKPQFNERTGQYMIQKAADHYSVDLTKGFPLLTTKPVQIRWVGEELFWMLRGETDSYSLFTRGNGVNIWNPNAFQHYLERNGLKDAVKKNTLLWNELYLQYGTHMKENKLFKLIQFGNSIRVKDSEGKPFDKNDSTLGPIYGEQWRGWKGRMGDPTDQLKKLVEGIKKDPGSRYHVLSAWNVGDLDNMVIKPCHPISHFTISRNKDLECHLFQRSCDVFLGVPFNTPQYALLNHLISRETDKNPIAFHHTFSNVHAYNGLAPRSDFLRNESNLKAFQRKLKIAEKPEHYLEMREEYLRNAPAESEGNERKDQIPFILEQLSKEPKSLPVIKIQEKPLFELIERPAKEIIQILGYHPHEWDCRAVMAA